MISYYASTRHGYTFGHLVEARPETLGGRTRILGYSRLRAGADVAGGLHVLTDFERLHRDELGLVRRLHASLSGRPGVRVLGDPTRWLDRASLLERLHDAGVNDFRAHRLDQLRDPRRPVRLPAFLRWADDHGGSLGEPVTTRSELDAAITRIAVSEGRRWRRSSARLLIVELVDPRGSDGLYRKHSMARIGDRLVPRHVLFSRDAWVTKHPDVVTDATAAEEAAFVAAPPDVETISRAFELAGVDYGRIDYGYVDGMPQVWEVNTNPMLTPGAAPHPLRRASQDASVTQIADALLRAEADAAQEVVVPSPLLAPLDRLRWNAGRPLTVLRDRSRA